ncbi:RHS repeat-associated core domain-containing protein, partial [Vibrio sp.]|uniref:RHS repeat-associated core domain-containing protein n=1 Tax=Vibrio sp. TaxID=678 RepID=UPI00311DEFE4
MKIHKFIFFLLMFVVSSANATRVDVYMKDISRDTYQFYAKLVEPRPMTLIHGEVAIPIPLGPETPEIERTSYLRVWKQGSQWKAERFTHKQTAQYNEFVRTSQNNKLVRAAHNSYGSSSSVYVRMGSYKFSINNYKSSPSVVQSGIVSGLINSQFAYPYASFTQTENSISVDSYVTDGGQAALSLSIPFAQKQARLSFVENSYRVEGLESLKADPSVTVNTTGNLTTIDVEHEDKVVSYFFKTQTWIDDASGIKNANGVGWAKAPYQANYLSAIGQCERLKSQSEPSCYLPIQLDYGRTANLNTFPYLAGWKDDKQVVTNNYKYMGGVMAIVSRDTKQTSDSSRVQSTYSYTVNASGQPKSLSQENVPNPSSNTRNLTTYITHGDYAGLANKIERFGYIDNAEYRLSETDIEWRLTANGQAQKARVVESVYDIDGNVSQTKTIENSYDDQNRLEKRITITDNNNGEQIEDQVEYRFENDYAVGKIERRSIISPAYENGVSDQLVKEFEYVYRDDKLVEQITRQGGFETREVVTQDSQDRVRSRKRTVNGEIVLQETIDYHGENVSKRCENGICIDYEYQTTANGRVESSLYNGTLYNKTRFDNNGRIISKTIRGVTQSTQYYAIGDVPSGLQEWSSLCPSDTVNVVYQTLPESMVCVTSRGQYSLRKGLNDRFIISGESIDEEGVKSIIAPHFEGDAATRFSVTKQLDQQNIEYELNGQTQKRLEVTPSLTETYDKWGNSVRRYYDITGLLYQVDDHLGNTVRFTYNASGKLTSSELNNNPATRIVHKYDSRNLRTDTIDPTRGHWQYHYNVKNQLEWQQDANGDRTVFRYDVQNRIKQLTTPYSTTCYEYPSQLPLAEPKRITQVSGMKDSCNGHPVQYEENKTYQWPNGWVKKRDITLEDGRTHTTHYTYYDNGEIKTESSESILGNDFSVEVGFKNGFAYKWSNTKTGAIYKEIITTDADNQPLHIKYGNGLEEFYQYDRTSGQVIKEWAMRQGRFVYEFEYLYDEDDRLITRKRHFYYRNRSETSFEDEYEYDSNNRLSSHTLKKFCINDICQSVEADNAIDASAEYSYDNYGNITFKTGVGEYFYESQDPYKLTRLEEENGDTRLFTYDENGNLLSDQLRNFSYENNRLVKVERSVDITSNAVVDRDQTRFTYGPNGQQIVRTDKRFDFYSLEWNTQTTYNAGAYSYMVAGGEQNVAQETFGGNGFAVSCKESGCETAYSHNDRLGQQIMTTSDVGEIISQTFTDPFGATHNVALPEADSNVSISPTYSSSFGHAGIAGFDLIHMKGRVYDPFLGRFIQADPFVLGKEAVASYNRYAFKLNSPVNMIDPSGYWGFTRKLYKKAKRAVKKVGKELSRAESRIRNEAKRAESRVRNEVKRAESRVRNEAKRVESQIRHESKRFERRARHEVGRWESDARMTVKMVHTMIKENPEVAIAMAVGMWLCPASATYLMETYALNSTLAYAAAGALTGATTHLISNKGDLKGIEKSILSGAVTAGIANGVAHGVMELDVMANLAADYQMLADGIKVALKSIGMATADNLIYGKDFSDALTAGVLRNIANELIDSNMKDFTVASQMTVSAVAGGIITTEVYGGSFSENFAQGAFSSIVDYAANALGVYLKTPAQQAFFGEVKQLDYVHDKEALYESLEFAMDFTPVVSNGKALYESSTGDTLFTGRTLEPWERAISAASIFGGPIAKGVKHGGTFVPNSGRKFWTSSTTFKGN